MAMKITDTAGVEIRRIPYDLDAGEESQPLVLLVTPEAQTRLKSGTSAKVKVMARLTGSGAPFVDLGVNNGIDLAGFPAGVPVSFDVKVVAQMNIVGVERIVLPLVVARSSQAGYLA
jgi:hypothetical protein